MSKEGWILLILIGTYLLKCHMQRKLTRLQELAQARGGK